jgi:pyruvate dehydrogenase E2 component (dihydrolipoamide acetyltransferase)
MVTRSWEVLRWRVRVGDEVTEGTPLVDVSVHGSTFTITAPEPGVVTAIDVSTGEIAIEPPTHPRRDTPNMNRFEFKLPDIGEGVAEGEIVRWHVQPGDTVREDQILVEVMTDKATVEITSPKAGTVVELGGAVGQVIKVHAVLVVLDLGATATDAAEKKKDEPVATAVGDLKDSLPGTDVITVPAADEYVAPDGRTLATPATRKLARDLGVDLTRVRPTGPHGRVLRDDVLAHHQRRATSASTVVTEPPPATPPTVVTEPPPATPPTVVPAAQVTASVAPAQPPSGASPAPTPGITTRAPIAIASPAARPGELLEERVPFAGVRRRIADRMSLSKHTAAHFTFVEECDVGELKDLRARMKPRAEARGVKLTFLPFIVKAVVAALKKHPILNAALDESTQELVYRKYYNIGIATSSDAGLIVPVVKHADQRSIVDIAREIDRLANDVRGGRVRPEDLQGSTFTVTSLGAQGGLFATPILNFPEVGILGVHQIKQKPVVRDGQIVIGEVMLLSLSFDHRVVDGHVGAAFAYDVIHYLQEPDELLLEI